MFESPERAPPSSDVSVQDPARFLVTDQGGRGSRTGVLHRLAARLTAADDLGGFHVETVERDGHAELRLVAELDMDAADRLAQALRPVFDHGVPKICSTRRSSGSSTRAGYASSFWPSGISDRMVRRRALCAERRTLRVLDIVGMTTLFTIT